MQNNRGIAAGLVIMVAVVYGALFALNLHSHRLLHPGAFSSVLARPPTATRPPMSLHESPRLTHPTQVTATLKPNISATIDAPAALPRILRASLNPSVAAPGEMVSGTVVTTSNVASVEARIAGYSQSLSKTGVGVFRMTYQVPKLPFFARQSYLIEVIARNTRGDTTSIALPITIR